ncbi:tetratricopeptide repeat protein [Silvibacterium sp.]|uniref:tetratricopeptide repeat protein n=1 Tax=Silvibacterium sp. TaxID=1964179 RepID=UPI0039E5E06A
MSDGPIASTQTVTRYSRHDALRILRIPARQLRGWERAGLIVYSESYSFQELGQLCKLRDLRAMRLSAARIRASVTAMQAVSGMLNPLVEAGSARSGSRLAFRHSGAWMEPVTRQFVFDFDGRQRVFEVEGGLTQAEKAQRVSTLFLDAVRCEEAVKLEEAIGLYQEILELDPNHAPSAINLGTIFYNQRQFGRSEELYRQATVSDPGYALAFFDLGNVLDELQRVGESIEAYKRAITLVPKYADAHYNLALAYERRSERRKALRHWMAYVKLDPVGPWSNHARSRVKAILEREKLSIVWRREAS